MPVVRWSTACMSQQRTALSCLTAFPDYRAFRSASLGALVPHRIQRWLSGPLIRRHQQRPTLEKVAEPTPAQWLRRLPGSAWLSVLVLANCSQDWTVAELPGAASDWLPSAGAYRSTYGPDW